MRPSRYLVPAALLALAASACADKDRPRPPYPPGGGSNGQPHQDEAPYEEPRT